jgi:hypothetical protein
LLERLSVGSLPTEAELRAIVESDGVPLKLFIHGYSLGDAPAMPHAWRRNRRVACFHVLGCGDAFMMSAGVSPIVMHDTSPKIIRHQQARREILQLLNRHAPPLVRQAMIPEIGRLVLSFLGPPPPQRNWRGL